MTLRGNVRGAALLVLAAFIFTGEAAVLRLIGDRVSPGQLILARGVAQSLLIGGLILAMHGVASLRTSRLHLHAVRGGLSVVTWGFYYASFAALDIALATTLSFATSLFAVAIIAPLLGEKVGFVRAFTTVLGFIGVAVAMRLGTAGFEPAMLYGVAAAFFSSCIIGMNRILTRTESTPTMMLYIGLSAALAGIPAALAMWRPLSGHDLALCAVVGVCGTIGMSCTIEAFRTGEVSAMAPFPYVRLVFAVAIGWLDDTVAIIIILIVAAMLAKTLARWVSGG